jgi:hypothetical protein
MWNLWKERNIRNFKQNPLSTQFVWNKIKENVQESIASSTWMSEDRILPMEEEDIFRWWNLELAFQQANKSPSRKTENTNQAWKPLKKGTIKLNFDNTSKDNPRKYGAGGLLRDLEGRILAMFTNKLGYNSNNGVELEGLIRGLDMAKHQGITSIWWKVTLSLS